MRRRCGGFPILQSSFTLAKEGGSLTGGGVGVVTDRGEGWVAMMVASDVWGIWKPLRTSGVLKPEGPAASPSPSLGLSFPPVPHGGAAAPGWWLPTAELP